MKKKNKKIILNKSNYIERDESWLSFNERVLYQTKRPEVPFEERMKFLAITNSNLDEFIMVRFASHLGLEGYDKLRNKILKFKRSQEAVYVSLIEEMERKNVIISKYKDLTAKQKKQVDKIFDDNLYPLLVPTSYDPSNPFPMIKGKELHMMVGIRDKYSDFMSIIPLHGIQRVFELKSETKQRVFIMLEDIIYRNLNKIYGKREFYYKGLFRLIRSASMELDMDDDRKIVDRMKDVLRQREVAFPVLLEVSSNVPKDLLFMLSMAVGINEQNVYRTTKTIDFGFLMSSPFGLGLQYPKLNQVVTEGLESNKNLFKTLDKEDVLIHHPYESFEPIINLLKQAAVDKDVMAIKQTLYRVSSKESPIIEALCEAASNGKQVTVMVEIKARFDEGQNITLIDKLTTHGCNVIYGFEHLKTHCKFALIVKRNKDGLKTYAHIGTGNYNDKTAKIYTDLSLLTSDKDIVEDLVAVFNILSGFAEPLDMIKSLYFSPKTLRDALYSKIDREIKHVKEGKKGLIILKLNSLSDRGIIAKLYEASEKGVMVNIICRGVCSMMPINKNIRIQSTVGRFLEHSRIYYFHDDNKQDIYISSADLLTRNLDRRVEVMVPLKAKNTRSKLLRILINQSEDRFNSFFMNNKGNFTVPRADGVNVHEAFLEKEISDSKVKRSNVVVKKK